MNGLDNEWESRIYELTPETQVVEVCIYGSVICAFVYCIFPCQCRDGVLEVFFYYAGEYSTGDEVSPLIKNKYWVIN